MAFSVYESYILCNYSHILTSSDWIYVFCSYSEESYLEDSSSYKLHGRLKTEIHYFSDIYKTFMA